MPLHSPTSSSLDHYPLDWRKVLTVMVLSCAALTTNAQEVPPSKTVPREHESWREKFSADLLAAKTRKNIVEIVTSLEPKQRKIILEQYVRECNDDSFQIRDDACKKIAQLLRGMKESNPKEYQEMINDLQNLTKPGASLEEKLRVDRAIKSAAMLDEEEQPCDLIEESWHYM